MASKAEEAAIRNYLQALQNPESLRDDTAIAELQKRLEKTEDPLERLKLHAQLEQAQQVDPSAYEADFVAHVKHWAQQHGVSADSFKAEGVPDDVLSRAGLDSGRRRPRTTGGGRRHRVSRDDVRQVMRQQNQFTLPQIQQKTGASRETVRAAIKELLEAGEIEHVAIDQAHQGRGRTPSVYQRT